MGLVKWTSSNSGDWSTPADWTNGALPGASDDVQIEVSGVTVTVSTGTLAANSLTTALSALSVSGGTLSVGGTTTLGGAYTQSGGTVALDNTATFASGATQTGGLLQALNGLVCSGAYALSGGTLTLANSATFNGGLAVSSAGIVTQTGGLLLDAGNYTQSAGTVTLAANGATLQGAVSLTGGTLSVTHGARLVSQQSLTVGGGTLFLGGSDAMLFGQTVQTGGLVELGASTLESEGTYTEDGGALVLYALGGTFNTLLLEAGSITSYAPSIVVDGTYTQTGGTLTAYGRGLALNGRFSQAAGSTIDINTGALALAASGSLAGTIAGGGALRVASGTTTLASGVVLSQQSIVAQGGTLLLGASMTYAHTFTTVYPSSLALAGHTLTLTGTASLGGELGGSGTLVVAGGGQFNGLSLDGTAVVDLTTVVNQTGSISLGQGGGSRAQLDIAKTGRLAITGNFTVADASGNGTLANAGYLTKSGGSGTATIYADVASTAVVGVGVGTLAFSGPSSSFSGSVSGTGTFELAQGQASFGHGLSLTVSRVLLGANEGQLTLANSLAYAGEWSQQGGAVWLNGPAVTLSLSGMANLNGGSLTGSGTLQAGSASRLLLSGYDVEGTATLDVAGVVHQTSSVGVGAQQGAQGNVIIEGGAVWVLEGNASLGGQFGNASLQNGTITNNGLLEKLNGSAGSAIVGTLVNTGTLACGNATLTLNGGGVLGGTLTGHGAIDLQGSYTLASGLSLGVGKLGITSAASTVTLAGSLSDSGAVTLDAGTLQLGGNTLTVAGLSSLEGGTLAGPGTYLANGGLTLGDNFALSQGTLSVSGLAEQTSDISVGDVVPGFGQAGGGTAPASAATLLIQAGATLRLDNNVNITSNGTLAVAGTLSALGAFAQIGPSVVDTGVIAANSAQLQFLGPVGGAGLVSVGSGGSLEFEGSVSAGTTIGFTGGTGALQLDHPGTFAATITGFQSGDVIELAGINAPVISDTLVLSNGGKVVTIGDPNGDSASLTFAAVQTSATLSLSIGAHGDVALVHT